jgi:VanZ family protein
LKSSKQNILLFILLSLTTLCIAILIVQYQDVSQQPLLNADFSAKLNQWQSYKSVNADIAINDKVLSLSSHATNTSVGVHQTITAPMGSKMVRLRASLRTKEVIAGENSWDKARLLLVQYFEGKAKWSLPHTVVALEGTNDWQEVSKVFTIAANCSEFRVVVQMSHCSGELFLQDLSLHQVEETTLYKWVKWFVHGAWISFIFFLFVPYLKNTRFVLSKSPALFTIAVILIGTAMPAAVKNNIKKTIDSELTEEIHEISTQVSPAKHNISQPDWLQPAIKKIDITKIAHFALFALLVLILRQNNPARPVTLLMFDIFMLACATELNQLFIESRSPLVIDVIIDMTGGGAGLLVAESLRSVEVRRRDEDRISGEQDHSTLSS